MGDKGGLGLRGAGSHGLGTGLGPFAGDEELRRRRLVHRYLQTLDRGDPETIDALVDEFVDPAYIGRFAARELRGRDALKSYLAAFREAFRWIQHTIRAESVDEDRVRVRALLRAVRADPRGQEPAAVWPVAYDHRIVGGRIVEGWHAGRPVSEILCCLDRLHV